MAACKSARCGSPGHARPHWPVNPSIVVGAGWPCAARPPTPAWARATPVPSARARGAPSTAVALEVFVCPSARPIKVGVSPDAARRVALEIHRRRCARQAERAVSWSAGAACRCAWRPATPSSGIVSKQMRCASCSASRGYRPAYPRQRACLPPRVNPASARTVVVRVPRVSRPGVCGGGRVRHALAAPATVRRAARVCVARRRPVASSTSSPMPKLQPSGCVPCADARQRPHGSRPRSSAEYSSKPKAVPGCPFSS